jgi:hypothetical protein
MLSRIRSFHHIKEISTVITKGNKTAITLTFKLIHKTVFPKTENNTKETKKGQKEVWTAKNGLVNIKEY